MGQDNVRIVKESPATQGKNELVYYRFNWAGIGTPSSPAGLVYDENERDLTGTLLTGSASVSTTYVTMPGLSGGTPGKRYRLVCRATVNGNVLERILYVDFEP